MPSLAFSVLIASLLLSASAAEAQRVHFEHLNPAARLPLETPSTAKPDTTKVSLNLYTSSDDLRGGNDNLNFIVVMRSGERLFFPNINQSLSWEHGSQHFMTLRLTHPIRIDQVRSIIMQTTFSGGWDGDNWDFAGGVVEFKDDSGRLTRLLPLYFKRFTADDPELQISF